MCSLGNNNRGNKIEPQPPEKVIKKARVVYRGTLKYRTHFWPMFPFHIPWKHLETFVFFCFFGAYKIGILVQNGLRKPLRWGLNKTKRKSMNLDSTLICKVHNKNYQHRRIPIFKYIPKQNCGTIKFK